MPKYGASREMSQSRSGSASQWARKPRISGCSRPGLLVQLGFAAGDFAFQRWALQQTKNPRPLDRYVTDALEAIGRVEERFVVSDTRRDDLAKVTDALVQPVVGAKPASWNAGAAKSDGGGGGGELVKITSKSTP